MHNRSQHGRLIMAVTCGGLLVAVGGLASPLWVKSPQQIAAETAPPPAGPLTTTVERRVLKDTVILRGTVAAGIVVEVTPPAAPEATRAVVTAVRTRKGAQIRPGEVILEVAGRPLFALAGPIPVYRDLRPDTSGADVRQLQDALRALGHRTDGDRTGHFGARTKAALADLYRSIGFDVPTTGRADEEGVRVAGRQITTARRALDNAEEALRLAREAAAASPGPRPPGTPDPVRDAEKRVQLAAEDVAEAQRTFADLVARTGPMLPAREVVFLPGFPAQVVQLGARVGAEVASPLVTLSSGALVVQAKLRPPERGLIRPGLPVEIRSELMGVIEAGVVGSVGELVEDEQTGRAHPMTVVSTRPLDSRLAGNDVRLTVEAASTVGEVLVVPLAAISAGADGRTTVAKVVGDGRTARVEVVAGVSGDGFVEVRPVEGSLEPGDKVVIGR